MDIDFFLVHILKKKGVVLLVGVMIFIVTYKFSEEIFDWIETQTFGMRDFILKQCDLLFIKVDPEHVTYALLFITFGLGALFFSFFTFLGNIYLGLISAAVFVILGWQIPKPILSFLLGRRKSKFQSQMID